MGNNSSDNQNDNPDDLILSLLNQDSLGNSIQMRRLNQTQYQIAVPNELRAFITEIQILDSKGRIVQTITSDFAGEMIVDLSTMYNGVFILRVKTSHNSYTKKFTITR